MFSKKPSKKLPKMPYTMDKQDCVEDVLKTLNQCNCCERHLTNRPTRWGPWAELRFNNTQVEDDPESCRCSCRQDARILCRMHPDTSPSWAPVTSMCQRADEIVNEFANNPIAEEEQV